MKFIVTISLCLFFNLTTYSAFSQKHPSVEILQDSIRSSFRGLSVPSDKIIWVSGSNGTVGRSTDAGNSWKWMIIPGFEKRDFRDIEAFDSLAATIMAVDNPADILKTNDGGKNWEVAYHEFKKGMFLDAMDFKNSNGIIIGDPVGYGTITNALVVFRSKTYGDTWEKWNRYLVSVPSGESIFSASGSNVSLIDKNDIDFAFITGGTSSYLYLIGRLPQYNRQYKIPIKYNSESSGAFSLWTDKKDEFYISGGDYKEYWKDTATVAFSVDAGETWQVSNAHGYRSCIIKTTDEMFITCGTNGVDVSYDGCRTWALVYGDGAKGTDGFNVCAKSKTGKAVYFAGSGRIGKLIP
jgi:photosystem II stability/assembly factor-like uncharacterized protein